MEINFILFLRVCLCLPVLMCPSHVQIQKMSSSGVLKLFYHQNISQRAVRTSLKKEGLLDGGGGGGMGGERAKVSKET